MPFQEELIARALQRALTERLTNTSPGEPTVEVSVLGVHCHCDARAGPRRCVVHCFESEYYLEFRALPDPGTAEHATQARGRTRDEGEVLDAVEAWLAGVGVPALHATFPFVDREKRALEALEARCAGAVSRGGVTHAVEHEVSDIHYLWFRSPERSCRVSFYGQSEHPDARFHWDECELFAFRVTEPELLPAVLECWLCAGAAPSVMRREFPWLEIGPLADFYEAGKPVEGEFLQSWDWIEGFYSDHPNAKAVLGFIAALRAAGYDRQLRAGQSLWSFMLSRSRRHGLRDGQPYVVFDFAGDELQMRTGPARRKEVRRSRVELTSDVNTALQRLAEGPID